MQNNKTKRFIVLIPVFIVLSFFVTIQLNASIINTLYTVAGIMFSIGMSIVVTFNMQGIKNNKYIIEVRSQLNTLLNNYILYFIVCTISFLLESHLRNRNLTIIKWEIKDEIELSFNIILFLGLIMMYSIIYFVYNFIRIQKLNNSIFDELNK